MFGFFKRKQKEEPIEKESSDEEDPEEGAENEFDLKQGQSLMFITDPVIERLRKAKVNKRHKRMFFIENDKIFI